MEKHLGPPHPHTFRETNLNKSMTTSEPQQFIAGENVHFDYGQDKGKKKKKGRSHSDSDYPSSRVIKQDSNGDVVVSDLNAETNGGKFSLWDTGDLEERDNLKNFWISLTDEKRKEIICIDKTEVLEKVQQEQKISCTCKSCGRKRSALERQMELLYDTYYSAVLQNGHLYGDQFFTVPDLKCERQPKKEVSVKPQEESRDQSIVESLLGFVGKQAPPKSIVSVAEDLLNNDGQKFISVMEKLSEARGGDRPISQQNQELANAIRDQLSPAQILEMLGRFDPNFDEFMSRQGPEYYARAEAELLEYQKRLGRVEEEEYDEEEEEEEEEDEEDDDDEDEDDEDEPYHQQRRVEETYRMLQILTSRIIRRRLLDAYKEKLAEDSRNQLIEELEAEERHKKEKEEKKQKQKERLREKKRQQQLAKEEERLKREREKAELEKKALEEKEAKAAEGRKKKEEQRLKREAEKKKKIEQQRLRQLEQERIKKERESSEQQRREEKLRKKEKQSQVLEKVEKVDSMDPTEQPISQLENLKLGPTPPSFTPPRPVSSPWNASSNAATASAMLNMIKSPNFNNQSEQPKFSPFGSMENQVQPSMHENPSLRGSFHEANSMQNPSMQNPPMQNPPMQNPSMQNPSMQNPSMQNLHVPNLMSPPPSIKPPTQSNIWSSSIWGSSEGLGWHSSYSTFQIRTELAKLLSEPRFAGHLAVEINALYLGLRISMPLLTIDQLIHAMKAKLASSGYTDFEIVHDQFGNAVFAKLILTNTILPEPPYNFGGWNV